WHLRSQTNRLVACNLDNFLEEMLPEGVFFRKNPILFCNYSADFSTSRISPVISAGTGMPIRNNTVGAISANFPGTMLYCFSLLIWNNGTGFLVCAVFGLPSGLRIISAFP